MKSTTSSTTASIHARLTNRPGQLVSLREPTDHPAPGSSRPGKRILLVDDDPTVRDSLSNMLVTEGYFVIPAENGQQALDLANELPVDLVLLDLNMPVKNGWDTFEQFTREHPLIPIIIATARPNQLFTALSAGAGALLEKPMDIPTLLRAMKLLLVEPAEQRLARLVGKKTAFHYKPATARHEERRHSKPSSKCPNAEQNDGT
jgi:DNA-binding response OmpR family regulator